jgi:hypothetical protein
MNGSNQPPGAGALPAQAPPVPVQSSDPAEEEFAAFLEEEQPTPAPAAAAPAASVQAIPLPAASASPAKPLIRFGPEGVRKQHAWKRQTVITGAGACRVKSFRGKYSDQGLEHLDDTINEWLDAHPEVEVKFVTSTVDLFEGKTREPALVLNVWY